jgi:hypothetical protein
MKCNWSDRTGYAGTMDLTIEPLKALNNTEKSMNSIISGFCFFWVAASIPIREVSRRLSPA